MIKWFGGILIGSLFVLLVLRYGMITNPISEIAFSSSLPLNKTNPLAWIRDTSSRQIENPDTSPNVIPANTLSSALFMQKNLSEAVQSSLQTWNHMKHLINYTQSLPSAVEAVKEAGVAWEGLTSSMEKESQSDSNTSLLHNAKAKQCPYFLNRMNSSEFDERDYRLRIPCGLIQGSSITIIGIPDGLLGNFRFDLLGEPLPGEPDPPIILHYNVRLQGDKITEDPVIVQNTWTPAHDWGEEERCPSPKPAEIKKVDELIQCNQMVGKDDSKKLTAHGSSNTSIGPVTSHNKTRGRKYFPLKQGFLSVMTLRVGEDGIHMTVDGKHITSFAYRESLEPWLVNEVRISGDMKLVSVLASGLPTSEDSEHVLDLESLKSVPLSPHKPLELFIGVFSTANNFKRRMALRRTWMQYPEVRSGAVAVRFFVGLHKNQIVNEELLKEVHTYGDIQLMPFVDYYSLITLKTVAICIFGTQVVSGKYVMKTDDDAFVRIDDVLASIKKANAAHGLLYGLINTDAPPHRSLDSKWYISVQEWPEKTYPPWAHGPGYVVSHDIANAVYEKHRTGHLKMFKLEDVAMGIWISDLKKHGLSVDYVNEKRVYNEGCKDGYVVAHYQSPREMLCLWQKLQEAKEAKCCA